MMYSASPTRKEFANIAVLCAHGVFTVETVLVTSAGNATVDHHSLADT